jgi:hypothetical protein
MKISRGHVAWFNKTDGAVYELYRIGDDLYTAPISNVIDMDTQNRIGRYEAPWHTLPFVLDYLKAEMETV